MCPKPYSSILSHVHFKITHEIGTIIISFSQMRK